MYSYKKKKKKKDQNNILTLRNFSRAIAGPAACLISPKSLSIPSYSGMLLLETMRIQFNPASLPREYPAQRYFLGMRLL